MIRRHVLGRMHRDTAGLGSDLRSPRTATQEWGEGEKALAVAVPRCSLLALFCAFLLAGCAGYHLGPTAGQTSGARSVQLQPVVNKTLEPSLPDYVMSSMRRQIVKDGTFKLDTRDAGDILVTMTILTFNRGQLSAQPADVLTFQNYDISMGVQVTARERSTGKVLADSVVTGYTVLRASVDLTSAERQAMPLITDDFAIKATHLIADGTW
jgi:hypothetical protein